MFPMISTGPVKFFFLDGRSSLAFFRYEAGAQPSLPRYLQMQKETSLHQAQPSHVSQVKAKMTNDDVTQNLQFSDELLCSLTTY